MHSFAFAVARAVHIAARMIEKTHRNHSRAFALRSALMSAPVLAFGVAASTTVFPYATAKAAEPLPEAGAQPEAGTQLEVGPQPALEPDLEPDPDDEVYAPNSTDPARASMAPVDYDDPDEPDRRGFQIEGMIGGAGCVPGRAPCRYENEFLRGYTQPSLGTGVTLGWRARSWFFLGAMYRLGMLNPNYDGRDPDYRYAAQHTAALVLRPILPIWRFDLGLNVAPGYSRQVYRYEGSEDRDWTQGFSMTVGPTLDIFITDQFFLGAEVDFIFSTQRRLCLQRGNSELCATDPEDLPLAPTHQALFGLHIGGTIGGGGDRD